MSELTVAREHFDDFFRALASGGYTIVGPTVRDGAIVYAEIKSVADLPEGWTDVQEAGRYALERRKDRALFGYAVGPHSWKKYLYPPRLTLWRAQRKEKGFEVVNDRDPSPGLSPGADLIEGDCDGAPAPAYAFFGVRACEVSAMAVQDRVLMEGEFIDPHYAARRQGAFVVAVQCGQAGGTCFCVSMGTGPSASSGFDLALTEILRGDRHEFLVEVGTERGAELLKDVRHQPATEDERRLAAEAVDGARRQMGRSLETDGIRDLLARNLEHPRWAEVARRCLACGNCTMVCPTCFCVSVEDTTDLRGDVASRERLWDSCFTTAFSYVHGGSVRTSHAARYRQWLTHKLGTWHDQFGTSGCVGCGRCITWCPTGIDLTEEVKAIRGSET